MSLKRLTGVLACAVVLAVPAAAAAAPTCTKNPPKVRQLLSGQGTLESVIVDRGGHLYFTSGMTGGTGGLVRLMHRGATPKRIVDGVDAPGGLAWLSRNQLLLGFGDSIAGGAGGALSPVAGLLRVNRKTGKTHPYADGLTMANGVARARNGTVFASTDVGTTIDRVAPNGTVQNDWAQVLSGNGLVVSRNQRWLYAAQTFVPAAISKVEIAHPANVTTYFKADAADMAAGFDGMTRDANGNLYVAANAAGQVWRIGRDGTACVLADGLDQPSAVAIGRGTRRFRRGNLFVVGFGGEVVALRGALKSRP